MIAPEALAAAVDERRLWERHEALARFGATPRGGVNRQALSDEEIAARRQMLDWAALLGLAPASDPVGNFFLRLPGRESDLAPVLSGSHLDTQPTGGKYDGVFGVLAALEAVQVMRATGFAPRRPIDIVVWMNEEGSRFAPGMMGSEAFAGVRSLDEIVAVKDAAGVSVKAELARLAAAFPEMPRRPLGFPVAGFVEAHIEQGPELEAAGLPIGVVTGIQGKKTFRVRIEGEEAHAGTTPRRARRDALRAAAAIVDALHRAMVDDSDVVRFTVGRLVVVPNAPSVVPGEVTFSIDLRHPEREALERFGAAVTEISTRLVAPCKAFVELLVDAAPLAFPREMQALIRDAAERLRLPHRDLPSAAGHDARNLHYVCPTGMIFVPCEKGISHNEAEAATPGDLAAGARVLTAVLAELAERP
jgi:N-carbamoyl-L-amino-acid hydrolase